MDWVLQRLCFAFGDTDRSVSWTSVYSLIQRTWGRMEFVHIYVYSRIKFFLCRDSNLQPDLSLDYKPSTLTSCAIGFPYAMVGTCNLYSRLAELAWDRVSVHPMRLLFPLGSTPVQTPLTLNGLGLM